MRSLPLLLALTVVAAPALAGCGDNDDGSTAISIVPSGAIDVDLGPVEIPPEFPDEVPLPADLVLEEADRLPGETSELFDITGWYDGDPVTAGRAYLAELEAAGFEVTSRTDAEQSLLFSADGDDWFVSAGFYPDPVKNVGTSVGVTVAPVSAPTDDG